MRRLPRRLLEWSPASVVCVFPQIAAGWRDAAGIICPNDGVLLNPGRIPLRYGDKAIVLARSIEEANQSVNIRYVPPPEAGEYDHFCDISELLDQCQSDGEPSL